MSTLRGKIVSFPNEGAVVAFRNRSRRAEGPFFSLLAAPSEGQKSFVRIVSSKRNIGGAVERNRARRRLRAAVQKVWQAKNPVDLVLYARGAVLTADFEKIVESLKKGVRDALGADWTN
jgi:ribonuclease P protein component